MKDAIRIGLVGIGRAGWGMHCGELEGREDKFTMAGCYDVLPDRMARMKERFPEITTYDSLEAMVADPGLDVIDIATPSPLHATQTIVALRAGKIVFVEKPIATSLADARQMVQAAEETGSKLYFRHNRRFETAFQHIREIIDSGKLGEVFEIRLHRQNFQRRADWQTLKSCGGGQLNNWGPHIIDHSLQYLGAPVQSIWSDLKLIAARGDAEDHLKIVFRGENGRIVDMEISGGVVHKQPTFLVFGNRGSLTCKGQKITMKYLDPFDRLDETEACAGAPPIGGSFGNPEKLRWISEEFDADPKLDVKPDSIWDYLYHSIRDNKPFPVKTEEALAVMEVIERVKADTPFANDKEGSQ